MKGQDEPLRQILSLSAVTLVLKL